MVALTFDADMTPYVLRQVHSGEVRSWYDPNILRELRTTATPATIFITGLWASTWSGRRMRRRRGRRPNGGRRAAAAGFSS
jgi:peptidoglycan/xylan/chitin deacetylase (PgdA/CDA1 family)